MVPATCRTNAGLAAGMYLEQSVKTFHNLHARSLTDHPVFDEHVAAWSPDGKSVAFLSNRTPDPDMNPDYVDLFVLPTTGGEPRKIETPDGDKALLSFSPDDKWIAYSSWCVGQS